MKAITLFGLLGLIFLGSCRSLQKEKSSHNDTQETRKISQYDNFKFKYADFEIFYNKFISDSIFQISRIMFPIKGHYEDYC
jgi:hypothetical protein